MVRKAAHHRPRTRPRRPSPGLSFYREPPSQRARRRRPGGHPSSKSSANIFPPFEERRTTQNIYVLEGQKTGGTFLILGGSHPEEPAARLTTWILAENAIVEARPDFRPELGQPERDDRHPAERRLPGRLYDRHALGRPEIPDGRPLGEPPRPMARPRSLHPLSDAPETGLHGRPQPQPGLAGPGERHAHRKDVPTP